METGYGLYFTMHHDPEYLGSNPVPKIFQRKALKVVNTFFTLDKKINCWWDMGKKAPHQRFKLLLLVIFS